MNPLLNSIVEFMQENPHEYNLFKSNVEGKAIINNITEYDLKMMFENTKFESKADDYYFSSMNDDDLLQCGLNGIVNAMYHMGMRFSPLSKYGDKQYKLFGWLLMFMSREYAKSATYLKNKFNDDVLNKASGITIFEMLLEYIDSLL